MGKKCIAYGCSKKHSNGVSLFLFPTDAKLKQEWIKQVQRTRDYWSTPTANSCLCSDHFTEDCFEPSSLTAVKLGLKRKVMLKPDAVPTIFQRPSDSIKTASVLEVAQAKQKRTSRAYEKREKKTGKCFCWDMHVLNSALLLRTDYYIPLLHVSILPDPR